MKCSSSSEIENMFRDYYKDPHTQTSTTNHKDTKTFLDSLDLPIGKVQNERTTAKISTVEIHKAIRKLKSNKAAHKCIHLSHCKMTAE
jgi:hypothetical protein